GPGRRIRRSLADSSPCRGRRAGCRPLPHRRSSAHGAALRRLQFDPPHGGPQKDARMSSRDKVSLARQIAAEIEGNCKHHSEWWTTHEAMLQAATTRPAAEAATRSPLSLCHTCPGYELCEQWAQIDDYTGIAAGAVYVN